MGHWLGSGGMLCHGVIFCLDSAKVCTPAIIETFYSEIPLPFPNSSYLLEPSNPMANAEMRFLRLYNNLNQAIGLQ